MGLDRRLFISNRWRVEDILDTVESLYDVKVKYYPTTIPDYTTLLFTLDKKENRQLNVFVNYEHGSFTGTLLSLGAWGKSDEILKGIAERLGGFYNHEDCNSIWEEYEYKAAHNLDFHLRQAVIHGETDGRDINQFAKAANKLSDSFKKR